jgi:hypothetical protein
VTLARRRIRAQGRGPGGRHQVREFFTSREAVEAAREGAPLPSGAVITVVRYAAQLDAEGNPVKTPTATSSRPTIRRYSLREKRAGWRADYPEEKRNGEQQRRVLDHVDLLAAGELGCLRSRTAGAH